MLSCKEISRLYSESLDRKLPLRQRVSLWMHMQMCRLCSGFAKNLRMLRQLARQHDDALEQELAESDTRLSPEARDRIHRALGPTDG